MSLEENIKMAQNYLKTYLDPEEVYSIGTHMCGLRHDVENAEEVANNIINEGLRFKINEGVGLTGTVYMKGSTDFERKLDESVEEMYIKVDNNIIPAGVIVAVPGSLKGKDGEDYYLGTYPDNLDWISKDDERLTDLPIEDFVYRAKKVPKEFILGAFYKDGEDTLFIGNKNFISHQSKDDQAELLDEYIKEGLTINTLEQSKYFFEKSASLFPINVKSQKYKAELCTKYEKDREVQRKKFHDWKQQFYLDEMLEEDTNTFEQKDSALKK